MISPCCVFSSLISPMPRRFPGPLVCLVPSLPGWGGSASFTGSSLSPQHGLSGPLQNKHHTVLHGGPQGTPSHLCLSGRPMEVTQGAVGRTLEGIAAANVLRDLGQITSLAGPQCSHLCSVGKRGFCLPQGPLSSQKTKNPVSEVRPEPRTPGNSCPVLPPSSCELGQISCTSGWRGGCSTYLATCRPFPGRASSASFP